MTLPTVERIAELCLKHGHRTPGASDKDIVEAAVMLDREAITKCVEEMIGLCAPVGVGTRSYREALGDVLTLLRP